MKKETMGTVIAARRKELGMTQLELAEKMSVTDKAVSKWERGLSCPDIGTLPKLAEVLSLSLDELMRASAVAADAGEKRSIESILPLIPKAVCIAMGVAVAVLSALGQLDARAGLTLVGIGLACAGVSLLERS